jgi:ribosomal protein S12 methylthiotransferase
MTVRSTFIVGFPGETEEDFQFLLDWLQEAQLDRVGCFRYENVSDADSNAIAGHVPEEVKEERWNRFMQVQQQISASRLETKIGKTMDVLIDEVTKEAPRSSSEASRAER